MRYGSGQFLEGRSEYVQRLQIPQFKATAKLSEFLEARFSQAF
jgi:hypothetical protein